MGSAAAMQKEGEGESFIWHFLLILEEFLICNGKKIEKKTFMAALGKDNDIILYHMLFGKSLLLLYKENIYI